MEDPLRGHCSNQVRACGGLDQGGSGGDDGNDQSLPPAYSLKTELIGFINWSGYERHWTIGIREKEKNQDDSKIFGQSNWKGGAHIDRNGEGCSIRIFGEESQKSNWA